jgi:TolB-like protein
VAVLAVFGAGAGAWLWLEHSAANGPPRLSLVVLPFENIGGEAADDYLAVGIADQLTTLLAHIPGAFVIARATAYTYRGKAEDIRKIGRDLNVRYVVRGSIQRLYDVVKVNAELGSTETGAQLWSDSFDQKIADLPAGQEQIVTRMREALRVSLADIEAARSRRERPTNPDAFDLILQARVIQLQPATKDTAAQILRLYEQALERDPDSVVALTGAAFGVLLLFYFDAMPYDVATNRAAAYLGRARTLAPNSEGVLEVETQLLEYQKDFGLDKKRTSLEQTASALKLVELFPNNPSGYFFSATLARDKGKYDEAAGYFAQAIRLNPHSQAIKGWYYNMATCTIRAGHDREGLEWADRAMAAQGELPPYRVMGLPAMRAVAYHRTGKIDIAKRLAGELNERYPFLTWRSFYPIDPDNETEREQMRSYQNALKAAGLRDHLDPDADFGVPPDDALHLYLEGKTPTTAPGATTVSTEQLTAMLEPDKPLVIDTMDGTWYRSVLGAVGLDFNSNTHGTFTDEAQKRLERKLRQLTGGDLAKPIVAMGFNVARFDGYNLALRIRHAGYTNVYWYRGGREAWEVAGKPEAEVRPADW